VSAELVIRVTAGALFLVVLLIIVMRRKQRAA
jgi:hypothetical protein